MTCEEEIEMMRSCVRIIKIVIERQIPKKPMKRKYPWAICPACAGSIHMETVRDHIQNGEPSHCEHCGQAIDWSDSK